MLSNNLSLENCQELIDYHYSISINSYTQFTNNIFALYWLIQRRYGKSHKFTNRMRTIQKYIMIINCNLTDNLQFSIPTRFYKELNTRVGLTCFYTNTRDFGGNPLYNIWYTIYPKPYPKNLKARHQFIFEEIENTKNVLLEQIINIEQISIGNNLYLDKAIDYITKISRIVDDINNQQ